MGIAEQKASSRVNIWTFASKIYSGGANIYNLLGEQPRIKGALQITEIEIVFFLWRLMKWKPIRINLNKFLYVFYYLFSFTQFIFEY